MYKDYDDIKKYIYNMMDFYQFKVDREHAIEEIEGELELVYGSDPYVLKIFNDILSKTK